MTASYNSILHHPLQLSIYIYKHVTINLTVLTCHLFLIGRLHVYLTQLTFAASTTIILIEIK